jgi:hypothetical protein
MPLSSMTGCRRSKPPHAEAIDQGVHSAGVILNILTRRRDPGPPLTILTPEALQLRRAPLADRAKYGQPRSLG